MIRSNVIRSYAITLGAVAAAFGATLLLQRFFPYPFLFLFFAAVMVSAWFGGAGAGIVAVALSTLLADYFFLPPLYTFRIHLTNLSYFGGFVVCALVASWVSAAKRKTEEDLRQVRNQLEIRVAERTAELERTISDLRENERRRLLLESEKSELSDRLESRKVVEKAKGILQRDLKTTEDEAYRLLQRESQQRRRSMKEIAESIILNDELKRSGAGGTGGSQQ